MALPKLAVPTFTTILPVTKMEIVFRPWLVGDKKALLIATQSGDPSAFRRAIFDVLGKCILTPNVSITKLPATDVSWLIMKVRMHSDSDVIDLSLSIRDCAEKGSCIRRIKVDLGKTTVKEDPAHTEVVPLTDTIGLKMRSPTLDEAQAYFALSEVDTKADPAGLVNAYFDIIGVCIESVYDGDDVTLTKDVSPEAMREFISQMTDKQFAAIERYFATMPRLYQKIETTCKDCGRKIEYELNGLDDFFV